MKTWLCRLAITLLLIGNAGGCSGKKSSSQKGGGDKKDDKKDERSAHLTALDSSGPEEEPGQPPMAAKEVGGKIKQQGDKAVERKIVYTAVLRLQVEDFTAAEKELLRLVAEFQGRVEMSDIAARTGTSRNGHWRVRISPDNLAGFRAAAAKLGEAEKNNLDSQEVTEEFYGLIEDIKNKEKELESFRRLFEQAKTIPDILAVKRELERVQQELDRMQGRHKLLENLTSMTKVDIWLWERGAYIPDENPGFKTNASRTFSGSVRALVEFGQTVALIAVALTPWLPVLLVVALPFFILWRRQRRAAPKTPPAPVPVLEQPGPAEDKLT